MGASPALTAAEDSKKQAYELILGEGRNVFDLSREKPELRDRYGAGITFGQECLAARRMGGDWRALCGHQLFRWLGYATKITSKP